MASEERTVAVALGLFGKSEAAAEEDAGGLQAAQDGVAVEVEAAGYWASQSQVHQAI